MLMPSHAKNVKKYEQPVPLLTKYQVEDHLAAKINPIAQLKSGGYIVINVTEALVAVDVNSGRATKETSIEDTALKTNLEAADELSLRAALEIQSDHPEAVLALAELLVADTRVDEGLALLGRIPESPESRRIAATARTSDSSGESAEAQVIRPRKRQPQNAQ